MFLRILRDAHNRRFLVRVGLALCLLRCLAYIPLIHPAPDVRQAFLREPFLAILDIIGGGALSRFTVLAVSIYAYAVGWLAALASYGPVRDEYDKERIGQLRRRFTAMAAIAMGSAYLYVMAWLGRPPLGAMPAIADIASLTAASMFFLWLGEYFLPEFHGIRFLVAANILAASPQYAFYGARRTGELIGMGATLVIVVALQVFLRKSLREVPVAFVKRLASPGRLPPHRPKLPIAVDGSGVLPLLYVLAVFAAMRLGSVALINAKSDWIRRLAIAERHWTDIHTPLFWILLFVFGAIFKTAFDYARMAAADTADKLRKQGIFIAGVRPGEYSAEYLRGVWSRIAWIAPLLTMLPFSGIGLLYRQNPERELWPLLLIVIAYTVRPLLNMLEELDTRAELRSGYQGFVR